MSLIFWIIMFAWALFAIYYIVMLLNKEVKRVNLHVYESIPSVFTTIGILGTFVGIYWGLQGFDVENMDESIPILLNGLKTAFTTSIVGIILSLVFGKACQFALGYAESKANEAPTPSGEMNILSQIHQSLEQMRAQNDTHFGHLKSLNTKELSAQLEQIAAQAESQNTFLEATFSHDGDENVSELLDDIKTQINTLNTKELSTQLKQVAEQAEAQNTFLKATFAHDGDESVSELLDDIKTQINTLNTKELSAQLTHISEQAKTQNSTIMTQLETTNALFAQKFDEFADLLVKNNTEALVEVMKKTTEEFNAQMSELISRLVQENFEALNTSVKQMNQWQQENKAMVATLTKQFQAVADDLEQTSGSVASITAQTKTLTASDGHLMNLIKALQEVMIDDTKYQSLIKTLTNTISTLERNTITFDTTTNKLNDWVRKQMNFGDNVAMLLDRLKEIENIKDINSLFWKETKKQLQEGVQVLNDGSEQIKSDLEVINSNFYSNLNNTLEGLDNVIQRMITHYTDK